MASLRSETEISWIEGERNWTFGRFCDLRRTIVLFLADEDVVSAIFKMKKTLAKL